MFAMCQVLYMPHLWIFTAALWRKYIYLHFTDEETEIQGGCRSHSQQAVDSNSSLTPQLVLFSSLCSWSSSPLSVHSIAPLLSVFVQSGWPWNLDETASQEALLWPTEAYCSPILHPHLGVKTLAVCLSFSSPRDGVRGHGHSLVPTYTVHFSPGTSLLHTPYPRL